MIAFSDITGKVFDDKEVVYYRNPTQSGFMLNNGAQLIDLFADSNNKLVFVFSLVDHKKYIKKWSERKHDTKEEREPVDHEKSREII